jgi:uridylate kinase
MLSKDLKVMDATAVSLCKDNKIPIVVFNLSPLERNIKKVILGNKIGTKVEEGKK